MENQFVIFSIALIAYLSAMIIKYAYLGYIKSPQMIKHYESISDKTKVTEWQKYMDECKNKYLVRYALLAIGSIILFGLGTPASFFAGQ